MPSDRTRGKWNKSEYEGELIFCEGDWTLKQVAQRGCKVSFSGDIQNQSGHHSVQPPPEEPALAGCWTRWSLEAASSPRHSLILQLMSPKLLPTISFSPTKCILSVQVSVATQSYYLFKKLISKSMSTFKTENDNWFFYLIWFFLEERRPISGSGVLLSSDPAQNQTQTPPKITRDYTYGTFAYLQWG